MFIKINGFLGAAIMMVTSNVTFRGDDTFINNTAISGGSIYLSDSRLTFNGTSLFLNNTSLGYSKEVLNKALSLCKYRDIVDEINNGSGGEIFCTTSYLRFYEHSNFTGNLANSLGGAILMHAGALTIQGNILFDRNIAKLEDGGAMLLNNTNLKIDGILYLKYNEAANGGSIYILKGELIIQGNFIGWELC